MHAAPPTRAGTVALVGLPNAGKSSLLNRLLGSKLSIVTPFAQTTRERVVGIDSRDGVQMVFIDTPGIVRPAYLLHRSLIELVEETIADADVVVLVTDGARPPPELDQQLRPVWLFGETTREGCNRAGFTEQGQFATEYGDDPRCLVKLGCKGPVVKCNVPVRGWVDGYGGCPNVGGICMACR